jgi:hypothetical protein
MAAEVHQEGLQYLLEVAFSEEQSVPASFYVGLCTDASLAEDASLGDQTEVTGTGYARQTVTSNSTDCVSASTGTNDWKITMAEVTFTAEGTWDGANTYFVATTNDDSGKLLASGPLSETRTLEDTNTLSFQAEITLAG